MHYGQRAPFRSYDPIGSFEVMKIGAPFDALLSYIQMPRRSGYNHGLTVGGSTPGLAQSHNAYVAVRCSAT